MDVLFICGICNWITCHYCQYKASTIPSTSSPLKKIAISATHVGLMPSIISEDEEESPCASPLVPVSEYQVPDNEPSLKQGAEMQTTLQTGQELVDVPDLKERNVIVSTEATSDAAGLSANNASPHSFNSTDAATSCDAPPMTRTYVEASVQAQDLSCLEEQVVGAQVVKERRDAGVSTEPALDVAEEMSACQVSSMKPSRSVSAVSTTKYSPSMSCSLPFENRPKTDSLFQLSPHARFILFSISPLFLSAPLSPVENAKSDHSENSNVGMSGSVRSSRPTVLHIVRRIAYPRGEDKDDSSMEHSPAGDDQSQKDMQQSGPPIDGRGVEEEIEKENGRSPGKLGRKARGVQEVAIQLSNRIQELEARQEAMQRQLHQRAEQIAFQEQDKAGDRDDKKEGNAFGQHVNVEVRGHSLTCQEDRGYGAGELLVREETTAHLLHRLPDQSIDSINASVLNHSCLFSPRPNVDLESTHRTEAVLRQTEQLHHRIQDAVLGSACSDGRMQVAQVVSDVLGTLVLFVAEEQSEQFRIETKDGQRDHAVGDDLKEEASRRSACVILRAALSAYFARCSESASIPSLLLR